MHQQAMKTADTLRSFNEHQTNDGRFLIRYEGKDKLLIPYLVEVLNKTDKALQDDFGYVPTAYHRRDLSNN